MKSFFVQALVLNLVSIILPFKVNVQELSYNQLIQDKIQNPEMKFYSFKLDNLIERKDLIIDAKIIQPKKDILDSPLVLVSLNPLPNTDKNSQWICGQLGQETCFIPNKYLHPGDVIYIGTLCEECSYSLRVFYLNEEILKDGESKLFHLKSGDKKLFKLDEFFLGEKERIQINSFNMRMTNYSMSVQILDRTKNQVISVPVQPNWIGGQQAVIRPKTVGYSGKFEYHILMEAQEDGVFTMEARTPEGVSKLDDKTVKFEAMSSGEKRCSSYQIRDRSLGNNIHIEVQSSKGEVELTCFPQSQVEQVLKTLVKEGGKEHIILKDAFPFKEWMICEQAKSESAYYSVYIYVDNNIPQVLEYKKLLVSLLKKKDMYDIDNIQIKHRKIENLPQFRLLLQDEATTTNATTIINPQNVVEVNGQNGDAIHINGTGVAGIATGFIFIIPVLIGCYILMSIFVNTKLVDQPLKLGKID